MKIRRFPTMRIFSTAIFLIIISSLFGGCESEPKMGSPFMPLPIEVQGIELNLDNGLKIDGTLPREGGIFYITIIENQSSSYPEWTEIRYNRESYFIYPEKSLDSYKHMSDESGFDISSEIAGEWGEAKYITHDIPQLIMFTISPNTGSEERRITIDFNAGYVCREIRIKQLGR